MADSISHYFRTITHSFLDKEWEEGFAVYYKVEDGGKEKFLQFAQYKPEDYTRLGKIMREADRQEFFIHENDLYRYYQQCILPRLVSSIQEDNAPPLEVIRRTYPAIRRILSDYMDFDTSPRILRVLDEFKKLICPLFEKPGITFPALLQVSQNDSSFETHCTNVGLYCLYMGRVLDMKTKELGDLYTGGLLLDIGKKEFPKDLISKDSQLTNEDKATIRRHPSAARKVLNDMKCYSPTVLSMAYEHHENFDGTGYPLGISGEKISVPGRIARIMDLFSAMNCERSYRGAMKPVQILTQVKDEFSSQFDPHLLAALFKSFTQS